MNIERGGEREKWQIKKEPIIIVRRRGWDYIKSKKTPLNRQFATKYFGFNSTLFRLGNFSDN